MPSCGAVVGCCGGIPDFPLVYLVGRAEVSEAISEFDVDGSGTLDFCEFLEVGFTAILSLWLSHWLSHCDSLNVTLSLWLS